MTLHRKCWKKYECLGKQLPNGQLPTAKSASLFTGVSSSNVTGKEHTENGPKTQKEAFCRLPHSNFIFSVHIVRVGRRYIHPPSSHQSRTNERSTLGVAAEPITNHINPVRNFASAACPCHYPVIHSGPILRQHGSTTRDGARLRRRELCFWKCHAALSGQGPCESMHVALSAFPYRF